MTKRRFLLEKLIRDKMPEIWKKEGISAKTEILTDNDEFLDAITQKMIEELEEVFSSESQEELITELADFEEAYDLFKKLINVSTEEIAQAKAKKVAARGGFDGKIFCEYMDIPETNTEAIAYVEERSEKYPELDPVTNEPLDKDYLDIDELIEEEDEEA